MYGYVTVSYNQIKNKRVLGPWVAHLRMNVNKGIGKHCSSQSQAINFDRSCDIRGGAIFGHQRHNLNILGKGFGMKILNATN